MWDDCKESGFESTGPGGFKAGGARRCVGAVDVGLGKDCSMLAGN